MRERFQGKTHSTAVTDLLLKRPDLLHRRSSDHVGLSTVPSIMHEVLRSPGHRLPANTRARMQSHFGHDFSRVRVHHDGKAAESARAVNARAYTVGRDIVFGAGAYAPLSAPGSRLLAHELAHVVQQERGGSGTCAEERAAAAAGQVVRGEYAEAYQVGGAPTGLHCQEAGNEEEKKPGKKGSKEVKVDVPPEKIPGKETAKGEGKKPEMPSRLPIPWLSRGRFSLGLRLGFPEVGKPTELQKRLFPGVPDPVQESLRRAKIMNQTLTGKVPSGWEATDKSKLARAVWGLFSTNIAPGLADKITSGLSATTGPGGLNYELDLVLITDFSKEIGGGLSFTLKW